MIASRHNGRELTNDPTDHAKIALCDAAKAFGAWRLPRCTLVVTQESYDKRAGAAPDNAAEENKRLSWPWHVRTIEPLTEIEEGTFIRSQESLAPKISLSDRHPNVESRGT